MLTELPSNSDRLGDAYKYLGAVRGSTDPDSEPSVSTKQTTRVHPSSGSLITADAQSCLHRSVSYATDR